ncbi:NADP-dependent phosphogluconate dehydrogenase [Sedimentitalea sp. JM2-8]|uniref:6-phosphogluconate dehydrogenase, decarboxylating n=1 Tax=Sedimentitalea xiamensis TaxID=3050037 RepID=A0ABT7FB48_9RHOB|nr:NADP-dependent phosphogluconate dehydrogenase [Sedimentitalea xiamensis]MDK3072337.1 NADP-dependent phosphogluconate dehydrogenase [Sedimentitalea xiamensis]
MQAAQIGVFGLGTMGRALALNLADHGVTVTIGNRETDWIADVLDSAGPLAGRLRPAFDLGTLVAGLARPRTILCMIPSGAPMDDMIARLVPLLEPGDILIDGGNADFHATRTRCAALRDEGLHYVGMGVSGGAEGARHGPSLMVGCGPEAWTHLRPVLTAIAARYHGDPCVALVGPDGAGHFVKTVHNGIEYADMQMIAEIYGILRDGAGWPAGRIGELFRAWETGPLASFLVETAARALSATDRDTGLPMVDVIADAAGQKGTGRWTVIEALKLGQSASTIEAAVGARAWSAGRAARQQAETVLAPAAQDTVLPAPDQLAQALLAGRILSHAQGFQVMEAASDAFGWALDTARIAEIWRAGCIIRSALLGDLAAALRDGPRGQPPILSPVLRPRLARGVPALRRVVAAAALAGLPVPSLSAALAWYDSLRRGRGTANLIQAQRDIFGAHGFERLDRPGLHHGDWSEAATTGKDEQT